MDIIMGGPEGAKLVKDVADSQINIYIRTAEINYCMRVNSGKINIEWISTSSSDLSVTTIRSLRDEYIPFISLAHELAHARNFIDKKYNGGKWCDGITDLDEISATHIENKIRTENGLPLRNYYETETISIKLLDSQNRSLFYDVNDRTNFRRIPIKRETERYQY